MNPKPNTIIPVLGMSRSGTTLLTHWLHLCGLQVGEVLNTHPGLEGNGFWEDQDFFQLNYAMLNKNKVKWKFIDQDTSISYDADFLEQVTQFAQKNNQKYTEWAFKDPKTVLFLDAYRRAIPSAKYLIVYRHFRGTVDSMLRFDLKMMKTRRNIFAGKLLQFSSKFRNEEKLANHYLKSWIRHNQNILDALENLEEKDYYILQSTDLKEEDDQIFQQLKNQFDLSISYEPISKILDPERLQTQKKQHAFDPVQIEKAEKIYNAFEKLNSLRKTPVSKS